MTERRWRWLAEEEWDRIVEASPDATWFHSRHWAEAMARYDARYEARGLGLVLDSGEVAAVPMVLRKGALRKGLLARAASTHPGTYGGPLLAERSLDADLWRELLELLSRTSLGRLECNGNVQAPVPPELVRDLPGRERSTHVIELVDGDLRAAYRSACQRAVRKAERAGIECVRLTGPEDVAEYHALHLDSIRRWGKTEEKAYGLSLFEDLLTRPGAEIWGARLPSGELAAGGVFFFGAHHCVYWHGAMLEAHAQLRPSNAVMDRLIHEARDRGCRRFDFNPSAGLAGVEAFKESFGARSVTYRAWKHQHPMLARLRRGTRVG